jgi:hypothetical protein
VKNKLLYLLIVLFVNSNVFSSQLSNQEILAYNQWATAHFYNDIVNKSNVEKESLMNNLKNEVDLIHSKKLKLKINFMKKISAAISNFYSFFNLNEHTKVEYYHHFYSQKFNKRKTKIKKRLLDKLNLNEAE